MKDGWTKGSFRITWTQRQSKCYAVFVFGKERRFASRAEADGYRQGVADTLNAVNGLVSK